MILPLAICSMRWQTLFCNASFLKQVVVIVLTWWRDILPVVTWEAEDIGTDQRWSHALLKTDQVRIRGWQKHTAINSEIFKNLMICA